MSTGFCFQTPLPASDEVNFYTANMPLNILGVPVLTQYSYITGNCITSAVLTHFVVLSSHVNLNNNSQSGQCATQFILKPVIFYSSIFKDTSMGLGL